MHNVAPQIWEELTLILYLRKYIDPNHRNVYQIDLLSDGILQRKSRNLFYWRNSYRVTGTWFNQFATRKPLEGNEDQILVHYSRVLSSYSFDWWCVMSWCPRMGCGWCLRRKKKTKIIDVFIRRKNPSSHRFHWRRRTHINNDIHFKILRFCCFYFLPLRVKLNIPSIWG